jgi:hypothetical protein
MAAPPSTPPLTAMTDAPMIDLTNVPKSIQCARTAAEAQRNVQQRNRGSSHLIAPHVKQLAPNELQKHPVQTICHLVKNEWSTIFHNDYRLFCQICRKRRHLVGPD